LLSAHLQLEGAREPVDNFQGDLDPREFGLSAGELDAVADRLYDPGDKRLDPMADVSARFGKTRSRIRAIADALRDNSPGKGDS
jgi:hypothetical protein